MWNLSWPSNSLETEKVSTNVPVEISIRSDGVIRMIVGDYTMSMNPVTARWVAQELTRAAEASESQTVSQP